MDDGRLMGGLLDGNDGVDLSVLVGVTLDDRLDNVVDLKKKRRQNEDGDGKQGEAGIGEELTAWWTFS